MLTRIYSVAISIILSLSSGVASAAVVNFQFTGTVTWGDSLAVVGSQIVGTFSYDTDTAPLNSIGSYASYTIPPPFGISASVGGHALAADGLSILIANDFGGNVEDMIDISGTRPTVDGVSHPNGSFGIRLASAPGNTTALTGTTLPSSLDVAVFDAGSTLNYGWLNSDGGQTGSLLRFSIDSIVAPTTVPLPSALILMVSGILALGGLLRRNIARA